MMVRRLAKAVCWIVAVCVGLGVALTLATPERIGFAAEAVGPWGWPLTGVRCAGLAAIWIWWRRVVAAVPGLHEEAREYLLGRRNVYVGLFGVVEVMIVANRLVF